MRVRLTHDEAYRIMLDAGWLPDADVPYPGANTAWPSTCSTCGHRGRPSIASVRRGSGCGACRGNAKTTPEQADIEFRAAGYDPLVPYSGAHERRRSRCLRCGTLREPTLHAIRKGARCKRCDVDRRSGSPTLAAEIAIEQMRALGCEPQAPYPGTRRPWPFVAPCGHLVEHVSHATVKTGSWACHVCRRERRHSALHRKAATWGWTILRAPERGERKFLGRHACGYVHEVNVGDLGRCGANCPRCSLSGFRISLDGYLYLVRFPEEGAVKVGISNDFGERFRQLSRGRVVEVVDVKGPLPGVLVRQAERSVLDAWRENHARPCIALATMPGYTETAMETPQIVQCALDVMRSLALGARATWELSSLAVTELPFRDVQPFVAQGHYTHSAPRGTPCFGLQSPQGDLVGAAIFGPTAYPGVAASVWSLGTPANTVELKRLLLVPGLPDNAGSWFLSRCLRALGRSIEVVVAFSDPGPGHHGGVYQACNFRYLGSSAPSYHYSNVDGDYVHKRIVWNGARRLGVSESDHAASLGLYRMADESKYRYAYPLSRRARRAISGLPYPKPDL